MAVRLFFIFTFFWSLAYFQLHLWNSIALGVGLYLVWRLVRKRLEVRLGDSKNLTEDLAYRCIVCQAFNEVSRAEDIACLGDNRCKNCKSLLVEKGMIRRRQTLYEQTERGVVNNLPHVIAFSILVFCLLGSRNEVYHLDSGTYFLQLAVVYYLACAACQAFSNN